MAVIERALLAPFLDAVRQPDVKVATVFHPDLDETWVHLARNDWRATVSFADDDAKVYVVLRSPDADRQVYHDVPATIAALVVRFFSQEVTT